MTREHRITLSYVSDLIEGLDKEIEEKNDLIEALEKRIQELEEELETRGR